MALWPNPSWESQAQSNGDVNNWVLTSEASVTTTKGDKQASAEAAATNGHICQLHNDTLNSCLDTEGVYLCKAYSPRSYIIQKVKQQKVGVMVYQ